jgi:CysZ protein
MLRALALSIEQLGDRAILGVFVRSFAVTLALCLALGFGFARLAGYALDQWVDAGVYDNHYAALTGLGVGLFVVFGFRVIAIPVIGLFADAVVAAVERRHYPHAAERARPTSLGVSMRLGMMSVLRMIGVNLLMLPVYIVLLFTVAGPVIALLAINALLLGRDLGEMVAVRHLDRPDTLSWLRATRGQRAVLGGFATALFVVPFVNFVAPVVGAAMATHLFHGRATS